ncbi:activator of 90 kDa heat shock protein ATPase homolog 1 [Chironomus tepperi]|uniref:activator of 90 kDa heat shock protein ATPase homolog 1 n=1 Tax=Chironomus tepperi TaxID=113505 RepID=UPI00391EECA3
MAKWGEGDPRWIVEERPDATNVNNWHWKESNASGWSKDKLNELLLHFEINSPDKNLSVKIIEFDKLEGEATANNRKGKLIFFYEWNLVLKWQGTILNDEQKEKVKGKITIPNLSEENEIDEIDITVTVDESNDKSEILKQFMYKVGRDKIREQLDKYIKCLKSDYAKNLILPKKDDAAQAQTKTLPANHVTSNKAVINDSNIKAPSTEKSEKPLGVKLDCKTLLLEEKFQCKVSELWDCFSRIEPMTAFTRGEVKLNFSKNGEFVLFGGNISGKFTEIVDNKKMVMTWRYKQWPTAHYSNVEMEFDDMEDHTLLKMKQTFVPASEYDTTRMNWQRYYFDSIRATFGFGSFLY